MCLTFTSLSLIGVLTRLGHGRSDEKHMLDVLCGIIDVEMVFFEARWVRILFCFFVLILLTKRWSMSPLHGPPAFNTDKGL